MKDNTFKICSVSFKAILPFIKQSLDLVKEGGIIKKCFRNTIKLSLWNDEVDDDLSVD